MASQSNYTRGNHILWLNIINKKSKLFERSYISKQKITKKKQRKIIK